MVDVDSSWQAHVNRSLRAGLGAEQLRHTYATGEESMHCVNGITGAAREIRTPDPIITNDVLYQLSYCGVPVRAGLSLARRMGIS